MGSKRCNFSQLIISPPATEVRHTSVGPLQSVGFQYPLLSFEVAKTHKLKVFGFTFPAVDFIHVSFKLSPQLDAFVNMTSVI